MQAHHHLLIAALLVLSGCMESDRIVVADYEEAAKKCAALGGVKSLAVSRIRAWPVSEGEKRKMTTDARAICNGNVELRYQYILEDT